MKPSTLYEDDNNIAETDSYDGSRVALPPMPPPLGTRQNMVWNTIGTAVYSGSNWAMQIALAKLGSPNIVGQYALAVAVSQPIMMLSQLSLRGIQVTDVKREHSFADYFLLRFVCTALAILIIGGVSFNHDYVNVAAVIFLTGLGMAFDSVSDIIYGFAQQCHRMDRIAISMMLKGIFSLLALAVLYRLTHHLVIGVAGSALVSLLVLVFYDLPNGFVLARYSPISILTARRFRYGGTLRHAAAELIGRTLGLRKLIVSSLPLGMTVLLNSLNMNVPRFFIMRYLGAKPLGIFAAMASLLLIGQLFISAIGQAAVPRLATDFLHRDVKAYCALLKKLTFFCSAVGIVALLCCVTFGRPLLSFLFTPEYASEWSAFLWLMAAGLLLYMSLSVGMGLTAAREFSIQAWFMLLTVGTVALFCWLLIPRLGVVGASCALFIGMFVRLVAGVVYMAYRISRMSEAGQAG